MQPLVDATAYRNIIGSLCYLVNTHPDLTFVVGYVSHFLEEPWEDHLAAVKKILHYVAGTCNWGVWFDQKKGNQTLLIRFSDADFAGDVEARKSTTWIIFFLVNSPITWQSMKQKAVPRSGYESEYIATTNVTCQALWLTHVLAEVQCSPPSTPLLRVDNKSAISLIKNLVLHGQSKYNEVRYHLVRKSIENGRVNVEFNRSEEQLGNILTKPLGRVKFLELRTKIGLIDVDGHNKT
jgi:hypothetical protein